MSELNAAAEAIEATLVTATVVGELASGAVLQASANAVHTGAIETLGAAGACLPGREYADTIQAELSIASAATISARPAAFPELDTSTKAIEATLVAATIVGEFARDTVL